MPLPTTRYSRFNLRYLASRYAGATFMLLALGLLAGLAYRLLVQPTVYTSHAEVAVKVAPEEAARGFDWDARLGDWRGFLRDQRDWGLLGVNLRHVVKLAVSEHFDADTIDPVARDLGSALGDFANGKTFNASLFHNRLLARLGPSLTVGQSELAGHLDFQSLAVIAADLKPPAGKTDWDFSFFKKELAEKIGSGIIVNPDGDDPFFKVFYRLHELVQGRPALSPHTAWRTTVDEVNARIGRESALSGDGGFGAAARRELLREIESIPYLAANCLYHANGWFSGDSDFRDLAAVWAGRWGGDSFINLLAHGRNNAVVSAGVKIRLSPIAFPRDTALTHIAPLATATLLNFIAARESNGAPAAAVVVESREIAEPEPEAEADFVAELEELPVVEPPVDPVPPAPAYVEMYDEVAAKQLQSLIKMHEEAVKLAVVERDAVLRQLNTARAASNRLSHEAITARNRADALRGRYDQMAAAAENDSRPRVPQQTAELFQRRDELLQRLISLREYCTEEHPFVKLALRDLRVAEGLLADHSPDDRENRDAEARATRLANLYLEWETATAQAESLEERARRHDETIRCLLDEVTNLERCISQREMELARAKESPAPIIRVEVPAAPVPPPVLAVSRPAVAEAREVPAPVRPAPAAQAVDVPVRLAFAKLPSAIGQIAVRPDWRALLWGLLGGLAASLLWMLLRELLADRFRNVGEAHRLVGLPVLANLPAYDQRSVQAAAETMKGDLVKTRPGRLQFMPMLVETAEPAPEARRGKIRPARRRRRWLTWAIGLLILALAGLLYFRALTGFALPVPRDFGPLSLPSATVPVWAEEDEAWGDKP